MTENKRTLESYENGIDNYISATASETTGAVKEWIDSFLKLLPSQASIIEIGSAFGRDAKYIESHGFTVERTDAANNFVFYLQNQGYSARRFNILTDDFSTSYDLVFANAVFLHFTPSELEAILHKIHAHLNPNGLLAFSMKVGIGEEWTSSKVGSPRYFCYWQADALIDLLETIGFTMISFSEDVKFMRLLARRK